MFDCVVCIVLFVVSCVCQLLSVGCYVCVMCVMSRLLFVECCLLYVACGVCVGSPLFCFVVFFCVGAFCVVESFVVS